MLPVSGRPFLHLLMSRLAREGFDRFVLAVSYRWQAIRDYFGDGSPFGWRIDYSVEEEPLGTGGALLNAWQHIGQRALVLNGDTFMNLDWRAMLQQHLHADLPATMALSYQPNANRFGQVRYRAGQVTQFIEKGPQATSGWINAGCYVVERSALEGRRTGENFSLERDVFPRMPGRIGAYPCTGCFTDIGTFESLEAFQRQARSVLSEEAGA
jgi:NDP-sugar pyrophosphorylase family protein